MDRHFSINGIGFVWDAVKAQHNVAKHGVRFEEAAQAFFDPFLKVKDATRNDEPRDAILGMDGRLRLLYVVHIAFEGERIRIISARRATRAERDSYED